MCHTLNHDQRTGCCERSESCGSSDASRPSRSSLIRWSLRYRPSQTPLFIYSSYTSILGDICLWTSVAWASSALVVPLPESVTICLFILNLSWFIRCSIYHYVYRLNPAALQTRLFPLDHHWCDGRRGIAPRKFLIYLSIGLFILEFTHQLWIRFCSFNIQFINMHQLSILQLGMLLCTVLLSSW